MNEACCHHATDPVCGMVVDPESALRAEHEGRHYYFCSGGCRVLFVASPEDYLDTNRATKPQAVKIATAYVRANCPGVCEEKPMPCPRCGMALEPRESTAEKENPEFADMKRRFRVSLALSVPVVLLAMAHLLPGNPLALWLPHGQRVLAELALATPVVLWGGWPFFVRGWKSVVSRHLNMFTLIALGVSVAFAYSVAAALFPALLQTPFHGPQGEVGVYFEAAAVIVTLVLLGQVLELSTRNRTDATIRSLLSLAPATSRHIRREEPAPVQRLADRIAAWFVPAVIGIAVITFIAWSLLGPELGLALALVNAVAVVIIACPCALGIATPMSIMVATGRGADMGVLFKDADTFERLRDVDTLVLNKSGTLTEGRPCVVSLQTAEGVDEYTLLSTAAALELASGHPLAQAIVTAARERGINRSQAPDFDPVVGKGMIGTVDGSEAAVGNSRLMNALHVDLGSLEETAEALRAKAQTVVYVSSGGKLLGLIGIADPIKPTSKEALDELRASGLRIVILTGDNQTTAQAIAKMLGVKEVESEVLPSHKALTILNLQDNGRRVAVAGADINDTPALAAADVGIATDIAMETVGVTLVKGDLRDIVHARRLSQATVTNIKQNLFFAFLYNSAGVPIAAGILYPFFGLLLSPMVAAAAMSVSSVSVIGNALRLRNTKL